jgi:hypothetical protein
MTQALSSRRAALGFLFGAAATLGLAPGVALACRYIPMSRRRPQSIADAQAVAVVKVQSVRGRTGSARGEAATARAKVLRAIKGKVRKGETITYKVSWFDCTGDKLGYIPPAGATEVLYLDRAGRGWSVREYEPLRTFENGGDPPKVGYSSKVG